MGNYNPEILFSSNAIYDDGNLFKSSISLDERINRGEFIEVTK
ncbi:hypothetical protein [Lactobacillus hominis]|nr:hypothetical protein [Lactobacillus hominis]